MGDERVDERQDDISLRELYLIFRSGFRWILGISLLVAIATFLFIFLHPHRYSATATVQVNSLTISSPNGTSNQLNLGPVTNLGYDAYRSVAMSAPILRATLKAVPAAAVDLTPKDLAHDVTLTNASGGNGPLVVAHTVKLSDPKLAYQVANAWADATVTRVRAMLASNVKSVTSRLNGHDDALRQALDQAQSGWEDFQRTDDRSTIHAELSSLDTQTASLQEKLLALDRSIARTQGAQQMTQSVVQARSDQHPADVRTQLRALGDAGAIDPSQADALSNAIASLPSGVSSADQDVATLIARTQLQQDARGLAGDVAERKSVQTQLDTFSRKQADLRTRLSSLDLRAAQLQTDLSQAKQAFDSVQQVAPEALAVADLVPAMANTVTPASEPLEPLPHHTLTATVVAFVLVFFVMVLAVFLRAAVGSEASAEGAGPGGGPNADDRRAVRGEPGSRSGAPHGLPLTSTPAPEDT